MNFKTFFKIYENSVKFGTQSVNVHFSLLSWRTIELDRANIQLLNGNNGLLLILTASNTDWSLMSDLSLLSVSVTVIL